MRGVLSCTPRPSRFESANHLFICHFEYNLPGTSIFCLAKNAFKSRSRNQCTTNRSMNLNCQTSKTRVRARLKIRTNDMITLTRALRARPPEVPATCLGPPALLFGGKRREEPRSPATYNVPRDHRGGDLTVILIVILIIVFENFRIRDRVGRKGATYFSTLILNQPT